MRSNDVLRSKKVVDLARFVDVNFDKRTCLRKSQMSEFITLIHEHVLEIKVRLWNEAYLRAQLQTNT